MRKHTLSKFAGQLTLSGPPIGGWTTLYMAGHKEGEEFALFSLPSISLAKERVVQRSVDGVS